MSKCCVLVCRQGRLQHHSKTRGSGLRVSSCSLRSMRFVGLQATSFQTFEDDAGHARTHATRSIQLNLTLPMITVLAHIGASNLKKRVHRCLIYKACHMSSKKSTAKRKADEKPAATSGGQKKAKASAVKNKSVGPIEQTPIERRNRGPNDLYIISTNVDGLRGLLNNEKKKEVFVGMVETERPDIIGLQEHKLQNDHVEMVGAELKRLLPEYQQQYWTCSGPPQKKGYAGVCWLVRSPEGASASKKSGQQSLLTMFGGTHKKKSSLKQGLSMEAELSVISVEYGLGSENDGDNIASKEGRVATLELPSMFVVNAYVPNSGQSLQRLDYRVQSWDKIFAAYLKSLEARGKPVIAVGDLNVAHQIIDTHNYYTRPWFPNLPSGDSEYVGLKQLEKQAGCTSQERNSFTELLENNDFVDTFRHLYPRATGHFSYWSVRAGNRPVNRGLRLDYALLSKSAVDSGKLSDSFILSQYNHSDHCPIGCYIKLSA